MRALSATACLDLCCKAAITAGQAVRVGLALRVNMAVVTVTTTGRCTSAHKGMLTCSQGSHIVIVKSQPKQHLVAIARVSSPQGFIRQLTTGASSESQSTITCSSQTSCMDVLTSGVNMERGTRVQKKPRETQCVANLRMPK